MSPLIVAISFICFSQINVRKVLLIARPKPCLYLFFSLTVLNKTLGNQLTLVTYSVNRVHSHLNKTQYKYNYSVKASEVCWRKSENKQQNEEPGTQQTDKE